MDVGKQEVIRFLPVCPSLGNNPERHQMAPDGQILSDCNRLISFNYGGNRNNTSEQIRLPTGAPAQNG